ncbi:hypothetical protein [Sphingomonas sp. LM7]|uniref:hypothetical protein n=1 Tax=Sphingomonas sp. LM7 TaxID=1938607 RepID=UPI000983F629|nr:hypothetical protein [Sphingomonas sp. LM7]AQR75272.1 hypothetical protein BXU08_17795 [Sphingomonas sp. LM7]
MNRKRLLLAASALAWAGVAQGEVLEITGEFPANNREASFLESVAVERFGGSDGAALQIAIERALTGSQFELLAGRTGRETAEGSISGNVSSGVDETTFKKKEKKCVSKNDKGKCIEEESREISCKRRIIDVKADIRIVRNSDGRIVYSEPKPFREEVTWCPGGNAGRTAEDVIETAIRDIAGSLRGDLVPHMDTYKIRVRESTKGLPKDLANRFKALVKLTKRDAMGACAGWSAMQGEAAEHPSLLFNLGLCSEQRGAYERAISFYQDAAQAGANEGREGAERATRLIAGREDAAERAKRRRG